MDQLRIDDLASPQFKANPYPFYSRLRAESPISCTKLLRQPTWFVTRYRDVFPLLKDERLLKDWWPRTRWVHRLAGPITRNMLNQDGPDHIRLRTLVHKAFTPQLVERLRQRVQTVCDELLNKLEESGELDLIAGYALPLPLTVISELLGIPPEIRGRLHVLSRSTFSATTIPGVLLSIPDQKRMIRNIRKLVAERRREPRDDLITALAQAEEAGDKLSEPELVATIALLLVAGYETTVNLIGNGALALLQHPDQLDRLRTEPGLAPSAVEEVLRYTSPLDTATQRFASEDMTIDSVRIAKGDVVICVIGSANHDETQFPSPETFDIGRQPNKHVAFGQGTHFCIGAPLARLEGQVALTTLFNRFPNLRLAQSPDALRWRKSLMIRGLEELPVAV